MILLYFLVVITIQKLFLEADPSNDISPLQSKVTYSNSDIQITFSWDFSDDQSEVTMMLEFDKISYFGFGIGADMSKGDIWVFNIIEGSVEVSDHYSEKQTRPPLDTDNGGSNDLQLLGFKYNDNGFTIIKFKRKAHTGDPNDIDLIQQNDMTVMYAHGQEETDLTLKYHKTKRGIFKFNFIEGNDEEAEKQFDWYALHKWVNIVNWGILADVAIIIARYWKTKSWRMDVHGTIFGLIIIATLVVNFFILKQNISIFKSDIFSGRIFWTKLHFILGLIVNLLIIAQGVGGFIAKMMILSKSKDERVSKKPLPHAILGHIIYILMKIEIGVGLYQLKDNMGIPLWAFYIIICGWRIIMEIIYQYIQPIWLFVGMEKRNQTYPQSEFENLVNYVELKEESQFDDSKPWCIFNNDIIDLSHLIHPGGQYIWEEIQQREISRFIYGAYSLESSEKVPAYTHSKYAHAMLKKMKIGELKAIPFYFSFESFINLESADWQLKSVEPITASIAYFGFQNNEYLYRTSLDGIESLGRYFLITSTENNKIATRPYTMVLCMSKPNQELRKQFIRLADSIINKQQPSQIDIQQEKYHELPFLIKKYDSQYGLSQYLHQDNRNGIYTIQGPYGVSFGLPESGHIVIICGGTGLFPFLDLLEYFLKYTVNQALIQQAGEEVAEIANVQKLKFKDYQISLFFSVADESELIGKDIYFSINNLQKYLLQPNFQLILRGKFTIRNIQTTLERFDQNLFKRKLQNINQVQRFLICGPPRMNQEVPQNLKELGVDAKKIHIV